MDLDGIPGFGEAKLNILREGGFGSLERLALATVDDLTELDGMGEKTALTAIAYAQEKTGIGAPESATDLLARLTADTERRISTGSEALDNLLGGGVLCGKTTQFYGKEGSGKSQTASQLTVNAAAGGDKVLFIDTEHTSDRLLRRWIQMAEAKGVAAAEVLKNIQIVSAFNSETQFNTVKRALDNGEKYGLIVIDGLMSKLRHEFAGREELAPRQKLLGSHINDLNAYAQLHKAAVVFTNQVMARPDAMYADPTTAVGGHAAGHGSKYIVYVRKAKGESRVARLVKSPDLPEAECQFRITPKGVQDVE